MISLPPRSIWTYKGVQYEVLRLDDDLYSQDADTGHWTATVFYRVAHPDNSPLVFVRSAEEFERKFECVEMRQ